MKSLKPDDVLSELTNHKGRLTEVLQVSDFAEPDKAAALLAERYTEKEGELKPTQLRQVFHHLKDVERKLKASKGGDDISPEQWADILPLMPQLAYARGRELIPPDFYKLMKACLRPTMLAKVEDYRLFVQFVTAILAYHKYVSETKKEGGRP